MIAVAGPPLRSLPRRPPMPPHHQLRMKNSDISTTAPTSVATIVPSRMSRSRMCDSSWATTPSSSTRFIVSRSPLVTATCEWSGSRPVAKAFGACSGTTYTFGFGMPAAIARPSTMLWSLGSSFGVTSFARADASTTRSPYRYEPIDMTAAIARPITTPAGPKSVRTPIA